MENLKADNQRLKEENGALIRVISKLSKWMSLNAHRRTQLRYKYVQTACEYCTVQTIITYAIHSYVQPFDADILIWSPNLPSFRYYYEPFLYFYAKFLCCNLVYI